MFSYEGLDALLRRLRGNQEKMYSRVLHVVGARTVLKRGATGGLVLLLLMAVSFADNDHDRAKRLREKGKIVPIEQLLDTLDDARPVHILEVVLQDRQGRLVYIIEYLDAHGIVWKKSYDATSGKLLRIGKGR
jgi:uncharacterized membrane protein YkoI